MLGGSSRSVQMTICIRKAEVSETGKVCSVLLEAARWLQQSGMPMWREDELTSERIASDVACDLFFLAEHDGEIAGTIRFQLQDAVFWPDTPCDEAAFVHRIAVRRKFAGGKISGVLLQWAVERSKILGRHFLRLDCEASRARLRAVYERFGFRHHSDRQVGPYFVARYEYDLTH
jgi:GNAT superfamily N-acetyltransferase